jgi:hypothetical protein
MTRYAVAIRSLFNTSNILDQLLQSPGPSFCVVLLYRIREDGGYALGTYSVILVRAAHYSLLFLHSALASHVCNNDSILSNYTSYKKKLMSCSHRRQSQDSPNSLLPYRLWLLFHLSHGGPCGVVVRCLAVRFLCFFGSLLGSASPGELRQIWLARRRVRG